MTRKELHDRLTAVHMKITAAHDAGCTVWYKLELHQKMLKRTGSIPDRPFVEDALTYLADLVLVLQKARAEVVTLKHHSKDIQ